MSREHRTPEETEAYNEGVWDLVLNLAHPGFLYVVFQVLILTRLGSHPVTRDYSWLIYGGQFLGAWTVFYTTLLRDMGLPSRAGTILALLALTSMVGVYVWLPDPYYITDREVQVVFGLQLIPAAVLWAWTMIYWRREKARFLKEQESSDVAA